MGSDEVFITRASGLAAAAEEARERAITNRIGSQVIVDFYTQLILSGYGYHMQIGTEDAGVCSTAAMDDELAWMIADNNAGYAMIPLLYEVNVGVVAGATLMQAMLEVDKKKKRYGAGVGAGTAFVPANLRTDDLRTATGAFYVTTAADVGITLLAKSAVPDSVELARRSYLENALADTLGYPGAWDPCIYTIRTRRPEILIDAASIVCHAGAATADFTGYGVLQFAQFEKTLVV